MQLRRDSDAIPTRFRSDSNAIPTRLRRNCDAIPTRFRRDSDAIPKRFRSESAIPTSIFAIPKRFRKTDQHFCDSDTESAIPVSDSVISTPIT
jgi:hypothetical protein